MFYNQEVLGKRKGGLSLYWLAATLGPGSARFKKLSKKELLKCDVPKACQKLIEPDEPLALRLSSNLMLGVTRVYNQQCILLHQDTTTTHSALRQAIIQFKAGTTYTDPETGKVVTKKAGKASTSGGIDQDREKGRREVINLRIDEGEGLMMAAVGPALFGAFDDAWQMMEDQLGRNDGNRGQAQLSADLGDEFETMSVGGDDDEYHEANAKKAKRTKTKDTKPAKATVARAEDINLPAHLNMEEDRFGLDDQNYGFEANLGDENFELGLDDLPELPAPLASTFARSSSTGALPLPSADRFAAPSSTSAGRFGNEALPPSPPQEHDGMMMFDGNDFGDDLRGGALGLGLDADRAGSPIVRNDRRGIEDDAMQIDGEDARQTKKATPPREESLLPTPPPSAEKKPAPKKRKPNSKKKGAVVQDAKTTLESEDLAKARDDYSLEMKKANTVKENAKYEEVQKRRAGEMITGVPRGIGAPELVAFFEKAFNLDHLSHAPPKRDARGKRSPSGRNDKSRDPSVLGKRARDEDDRVADRRQREREGTAISSALGRGGARAGSMAPMAGDYEGGWQGGNDFDYIGNDFDTDRARREGSAVPSLDSKIAGRGRAPSYLDESNIGRNRERAASISYSQQQMPWNQPFPGEEGFSNDFGGAGGPSSSARDFSIRRSIGGSPDRFGVRSRTPSVQGSLLRDLHGNRRSATPSFLGSQMDRNAAGGEADFNMDIDGAGPPGDGDDGFKIPPRPGSVAHSRDGSQAQDPKVEAGSQVSVSVEESEPTRVARTEDETKRFLIYAKRRADEDQDNELLFSDIVPVASTASSVAVAAFYHLLVLASRNQIRVKGQEEPYGEISLAIP